MNKEMHRNINDDNDTSARLYGRQKYSKKNYADGILTFFNE
jgi:hypothetical protein